MLTLAWLAVSVPLVAAPGPTPTPKPTEITTLTISERAGAARTNEPIRMGVPLAKGVAREVHELFLADQGGRPIPCRFVEAMRWPEEESLRWVHVIFQANVGARGQTNVRLMKGTPPQTPAPPGQVEVTEADGKVMVTNGVLKLVVKGANFNLFDSVAYDPKGEFGPGTEVVKPHGEGFTAVLNGKAHKPGPDSKVVVEEKGAEGAVLKASGKFVAEGSAPFEYVCRIHVFRNSPVVKVDFSYTNASGKVASDKVAMEDLSLVLPATLASAKASLGAEDGVKSGTSAKIFAKTSDQSLLTVGGADLGAAKGKSSKPNMIGWVDLTADQKGVAVGVRWFWQMFPKVMEAADGRLRAALYAKESGQPLDVYMGQARTHYLTFLFHGAMPDPALSNFFVGTQMPLRALASPKYYCRDTEGFGKLADVDGSLYPPDVQEAERRYDDLLRQSVEAINRKIDGATYQDVAMDSYGYLAWGDLFHWANTKGETDPWNILWETNYYDYPWACGLQFARTGDPVYLDILERNGLHLADVFMCHYAPDPRFCGACRHSPAANHIGLDTDYKNPKPYFSMEFNHHKALSILARYYFLGDLRAKDDFLLALNNAMTNSEGNWRQSRGPGAKLATLYAGYLLTRDWKCLDRMKACMADAIKLKATPTGFTDQGETGWFMMGVATEGMADYYLLTGDKDTLETIQSIDDYLCPEVGKNGKYPAKDRITTDLTFSLGVMYRQTGDEKYKKAMLGLFQANEVERRPKGFGQQWRNSAYAWYYLSNLSAKKDK